jgi:hypothetical protein
MENAEPRSSKTEIYFRLSLHVFGLSLCGFHISQNQPDQNGHLKCFVHLRIST